MDGSQVAVVPVFSPCADTVAGSQLTAFITFCAGQAGVTIRDTSELQDFAMRDFRAFWRHFLTWSAIACEGAAEPVCTDDRCEHAAFFPNLRLNYAENVLAIASDADGERIALTCCHATGAVERVSRRVLRERVLRLAAWLRTQGVQPGDRVAAVAHNNADAVVAALAAAAVGAVFSSASAEMGTASVLSRFQQLSPKILMAHTVSAGLVEREALAGRVAEIARGLASIQAVVVLDDGRYDDGRYKADGGGAPVWHLSDIVAGEASGADTPFLRLPFNHPLFILFSSGTTGRPKCIVHGAGGTLLEHVKEHRLHGDMRADDRLFFHTSTAWMMWNWQLSALACGVEIVLYDGPVEGPQTLWRMVAEHAVTVFGTSPPYLRLCQDAGYSPLQAGQTETLRAVMSTGSVLHDHQYEWVRENVGALPLQSISGGTDIIGCFVLGNPNLPVYSGESQCRSLGLDVQALHADADARLGELVCCNPFPSRPVAFFGDSDGSQFHRAYFAQNAGVWTHGDLVEFSASGGARLHGRSDSILKVNGVRIGPAEIYTILEDFPEIRQAMAVEQVTAGGDSRLVLLVVPRAAGGVDGALRARIRKQLAVQASPAHVPARIVEVDELPVTYSGKMSERAARDALSGVAGTNADALRNPACLDAIRCRVAAEDSLLLAPCPAASVEGRLRAIWERVLGFRDVDADDSFFNLGGSSIMALQLCQEINAELGLAIGPWILFHAPTLRALTLALDTEGGALSPIAPLKPEGLGHPVVLVPGMYGDIMELRALIGRLHCTRPLYGVRARGLAPGETTYARVQDMAADYLVHLRHLQPEGPYTLVGYSFGGLVAYEMACRLRAAGEAVEFLGLIDTDVHEACLKPGERLGFWLLRPWRYLRIMAADPLTAVPEVTRRFLRTRVAAPVGTDTDMPPLLQQVARMNRRAFARYRPSPYDGVVTVFRALNRWPRFCDPLPVWHRLTGGAVVVRPIAGSHTDIVQEPGVSALAFDLQAMLPGERELAAAAD